MISLFIYPYGLFVYLFICLVFFIEYPFVTFKLDKTIIQHF